MKENMTPRNTSSGMSFSSTKSPRDMWGTARQTPKWRDIGHGVLESTAPGAKHYIARGDNNKWTSVGGKELVTLLAEQAAQAAAATHTAIDNIV
jgi:hypothetical protein